MVRSAATRPRRGEPHAAVALVGEQALLREAAHHARDRRGRHAAAARPARSSPRGSPGALQLVDGLEVVLDRRGEAPAPPARRFRPRAAVDARHAGRAGAHQQHRHEGAVPHLVGDAAAHQVVREAGGRGWPSRSGRRPPARPPPRSPPQGSPDASTASAVEAVGLELRPHRSMYARSSRISSDSRRVRAVGVARRPAVGHVQQHDRRAAVLGEPPHVREDGGVRRRVLERDEDAAVHGYAPSAVLSHGRSGPAAKH